MSRLLLNTLMVTVIVAAIAVIPLVWLFEAPDYWYALGFVSALTALAAMTLFGAQRQHQRELARSQPLMRSPKLMRSKRLR